MLGCFSYFSNACLASGCAQRNADCDGALKRGVAGGLVRRGDSVLLQTMRLCDHVRKAMAPGVQALDEMFRKPQLATIKRVSVGTGVRDVTVWNAVLRPR